MHRDLENFLVGFFATAIIITIIAAVVGSIFAPFYYGYFKTGITLSLFWICALVGFREMFHG